MKNELNSFGFLSYWRKLRYYILFFFALSILNIWIFVEFFIFVIVINWAISIRLIYIVFNLNSHVNAIVGYKSLLMSWAQTLSKIRNCHFNKSPYYRLLILNELCKYHMRIHYLARSCHEDKLPGCRIKVMTLIFYSNTIQIIWKYPFSLYWIF